jgi:hypothetical protein
MDPKAGWVGIIRCGLHSGFPRCCIRFFLGPWARMLDVAERRRYLDVCDAGYVRCPDCIASGRRVQVLACPVGSHGGNVIGRSESHYERRDGRTELTAVEFFYRDRPGSYRLPVVNGQIAYPGAVR